MTCTSKVHWCTKLIESNINFLILGVPKSDFFSNCLSERDKKFCYRIPDVTAVLPFTYRRNSLNAQKTGSKNNALNVRQYCTAIVHSRIELIEMSTNFRFLVNFWPFSPATTWRGNNFWKKCALDTRPNRRFFPFTKWEDKNSKNFRSRPYQTAEFFPITYWKDLLKRYKAWPKNLDNLIQNHSDTFPVL